MAGPAFLHSSMMDGYGCRVKVQTFCILAMAEELSFLLSTLYSPTLPMDFQKTKACCKYVSLNIFKTNQLQALIIAQQINMNIPAANSYAAEGGFL